VVGAALGISGRPTMTDLPTITTKNGWVVDNWFGPNFPDGEYVLIPRDRVHIKVLGDDDSFTFNGPMTLRWFWEIVEAGDD
jgi:hypothetical protein